MTEREKKLLTFIDAMTTWGASHGVYQYVIFKHREFIEFRYFVRDTMGKMMSFSYAVTVDDIVNHPSVQIKAQCVKEELTPKMEQIKLYLREVNK